MPHPALPRVFVEIKTMAPELQEETDLIGEPRIVVAFLPPAQSPAQSPVGLWKSAEALQSKEEALSPGRSSPWWPNTCPKRHRVLELTCPGTGRCLGVVPGDLPRLLKSCYRMSFPLASWEARHLPEAVLPWTLQPQLFAFP